MMFRIGTDNKVFRSVVCFYPVDVMNNLLWLKESTKLFLHDQSMLPYIPKLVTKRMTGSFNQDVAIKCAETSTFPITIPIAKGFPLVRLAHSVFRLVSVVFPCHWVRRPAARWEMMTVSEITNGTFVNLKKLGYFLKRKFARVEEVFELVKVYLAGRIAKNNTISLSNQSLTSLSYS